jgi:hypothetical protein
LEIRIAIINLVPNSNNSVMWKSFGDKYDIERHDNQKHHRKIKSNLIVEILCVVTFLSDIIQSDDGFNYFIPLVCCVLSVLVCVFLAVFKWVRNNKELDTFLLMSILLFTYCICILHP